MKQDRVWYVILNSNQARILRNLPDVGEPPPTEIRMQATRPALRKALSNQSWPQPCIGHRPPGAVPASAYPAADLLHDDTLRFLRDVFFYLEDQLEALAFDGLVLIAASDILGLWHDEVSARLKSAVLHEETGNLTRLPIVRLAPAIREMLAR